MTRQYPCIVTDHVRGGYLLIDDPSDLIAGSDGLIAGCDEQDEHLDDLIAYRDSIREERAAQAEADLLDDPYRRPRVKPTDPERCTWETAYGMPWMEWCGEPKDADARWCPEHALMERQGY